MGNNFSGWGANGHNQFCSISNENEALTGSRDNLHPASNSGFTAFHINATGSRLRLYGLVFPRPSRPSRSARFARLWLPSALRDPAALPKEFGRAAVHAGSVYYGPEQQALRSVDSKLIHYVDGDFKAEFYDLEDDPDEQNWVSRGGGGSWSREPGTRLQPRFPDRPIRPDGSSPERKHAPAPDTREEGPTWVPPLRRSARPPKSPTPV